MTKPLRIRCHRQLGLSLLEILVMVAIMVVVVALLLPSLSSFQQKAGQAKCVSNLRAIATGFSRFAMENNNTFPGNGPSSSSGQSGPKYFRWMHRIGPYMDFTSSVTMRSSLGSPAVATLDSAYTEAVFHCPATSPKQYRAPSPPIESLGIYGYNDNLTIENDTTKTTGVNVAKIQQPSVTILLADRFAGGGSRPQDTVSLGADIDMIDPYPAQLKGPAANHRPNRNAASDPRGAGACPFLFVDGHVDVLELSKMRPWIDKAGSPAGITFKVAEL